jgi:hypothetical protein
MGIVYRARHLLLDLPVALKMVRTGTAAGPEELARFHVEARAVATLTHPGVVRVYDFGEHQGLPFFSMELIEGGSLADRLRRGPLPATEAARLVEGLARVVQHVHEHDVIHRDLKPANILLTRDGQAKVADFGLARRLHQDLGLTSTGAVLGTASYMSPEQAAGRTREVGSAADIYGLGAILYECLTGRPPFRAATRELTMVQVLTEEVDAPSQARKDVPAELEAICLKCLEKEPARRYDSAAALAEDLQRFLAGEPISVDVAGLLDWHARWARNVGYELLDLLGCGRTGFLYHARQLSLNLPQASPDRAVVLDISPATAPAHALPARQRVTTGSHRHAKCEGEELPSVAPAGHPLPTAPATGTKNRRTVSRFTPAPRLKKTTARLRAKARCRSLS